MIKLLPQPIDFFGYVMKIRKGHLHLLELRRLLVKCKQRFFYALIVCLGFLSKSSDSDMNKNNSQIVCFGSCVAHITKSGYEELIICTAAARFTDRCIHGSKPTIFTCISKRELAPVVNKLTTHIDGMNLFK
jgi:uncharacterized CHY-type Zn-finger protein